MLSPWDAWNQQMIDFYRTLRAAYAADIDANHLISMVALREVALREVCLRELDHD
jgi:hypothetical protein